MSLLQIAYVSSALHHQTDAELDAILESAVRHNKVNDLTGLLLYSDGNFLQVIEGPEEPIRETYARISADGRHKSIFMLSSKNVARRDFPKWQMGFHRLSGANGQNAADTFDPSELSAQSSIPEYMQQLINSLDDT